MTAKLTCRDLVGFLDDYVDGHLDRDRSVRFEHHLTMCSDCRDYLKTYRDTIRLAGGLCGDDDDPVPPEVPEDLVRAVLEARGGPAGPARA